MEFIGKIVTIKELKEEAIIEEIHETKTSFKLKLLLKDGSSKIYNQFEVIGPLKFNGHNSRCSSCDNNYNQASFQENMQNGWIHPCYPCNGITNISEWEMAFGG